MSRYVIILIAIIAVLWLATKFFFVVKEDEQVVIIQFGDPIGEPITEPGLNFIWPWQDPIKYTKKITLVDLHSGEPIPNKEKNPIIVDATARWRISDAKKFREIVRDEDIARQRIERIIYSAIRDVIAKYNLNQIIRTDNDMILKIMNKRKKIAKKRELKKKELLAKEKLAKEKLEKELLESEEDETKEDKTKENKTKEDNTAFAVWICLI